MKGLIDKIEQPVRLYFYFSVFDTLVGLVGLIVYAALTATDGPIYIRNQFFGLWLLLLIFYYGLMSIYLQAKHMQRKKGFQFYFDLSYFVLITMLGFVLFIFYCISGKVDAIIWSLYIWAVSLTNCWICFLRTKSVNNHSQLGTSSDDDNGELETKIDEADSHKKNHWILQRLNIGLKLVSLALLCFVLSGAITEGAGRVKYPPRGKFMDVKLDDGTGREYSIHYVCAGPVNTSMPVFMIEGDSSQSYADFLILQEELTRINRRSCIWDKPGLGFSGYLFTGTKNYASFYHNLMVNFDERPPYALVGWGAGGQIIYDYASKHPEMVSSLTFLDTYQNNLEFKVPQILKNWTQAQYDENKSSILDERSGTLSKYNSILVPWGFINSVVTRKDGPNVDKLNEVRWHYLTEKTWRSQAYFLKPLANEPDIFDTVAINRSIPINVIIAAKSAEYIINNVCPKSDNCLYEINYNNLSINERSKLADLSDHGNLIRCEADECDSDYFINKGVNFTVNILKTVF